VTVTTSRPSAYGRSPVSTSTLYHQVLHLRRRRTTRPDAGHTRWQGFFTRTYAYGEGADCTSMTTRALKEEREWEYVSDRLGAENGKTGARVNSGVLYQLPTGGQKARRKMGRKSGRATTSRAARGKQDRARGMCGSGVVLCIGSMSTSCGRRSMSGVPVNDTSIVLSSAA